MYSYSHERMEQTILLPTNPDTDTMLRVKRQAHPSPHQFNLRLQRQRDTIFDPRSGL